MRNTKAASRYARSLMLLAIEKNDLDRTFDDMSLVNDVIDANKELKVVLRSPVIKKDAKVKIMNSLFEAKLGKISMAFLRIVGEKGREALLPEICDSFIAMVKRHKHIIVAEVTTATPLSDEARAKVQEIVRKIHSGAIELVEKLDAEIIGGIVLKVGDKSIDASMAGQIREFRKNFQKNPYESQL